MHFDQTLGEFDKRHWAATNWPVAQNYIEFSHTNIWVPASEFQNDSGSSTTMSTRGGTPVRIFEDGVTNTAFASVRRARMWLDGRVTTRLWYTGALNSSTNAYVAVSVRADAENAAVGSHSYTVVARPTPTGTGYLMVSRLDEQSTTDSRRAAVTYNTDLISVAVRREGGHASDNYTGDFELVGVELFYVEKRTRQLGFNKLRTPAYLMKE